MKKSLKILFALSSISVLTACPANEAYKGIKVDFKTFEAFGQSHIIKPSELIKLGKFTSSHKEELIEKVGDYSVYEYYYYDMIEYDCILDAFHFTLTESSKRTNTSNPALNHETSVNTEGFVVYSNVDGLIVYMQTNDDPKTAFWLADNMTILEKTNKSVSFEEAKFITALDFVSDYISTDAIYGSTHRFDLDRSFNDIFYVTVDGNVDKNETYINPDNGSIYFDIEISNVYKPEHYTSYDTVSKVKYTGRTENGLMIDEHQTEHQTGSYIVSGEVKGSYLLDTDFSTKSSYTSEIILPDVGQYQFV